MSQQRIRWRWVAWLAGLGTPTILVLWAVISVAMIPGPICGCMPADFTAENQILPRLGIDEQRYYAQHSEFRTLTPEESAVGPFSYANEAYRFSAMLGPGCFAIVATPKSGKAYRFWNGKDRVHPFEVLMIDQTGKVYRAPYGTPAPGPSPDGVAPGRPWRFSSDWHFGLTVFCPKLPSGYLEVGKSTPVTVALLKPAPPGGATVVVKADGANLILPTHVTIPAGKRSAGFTVRTPPKIDPAPDATSTIGAEIMASYQGLHDNTDLFLTAPGSKWQ